MHLGREKRFYKTFIISTVIAVVAVLSLIFYFMFSKTRDLIYEDNLVKARTLFNTISLVRGWLSSHGGVYVLKKTAKGETAFRVGSDILAGDGRVLSLEDHDSMGRAIVGQATEEGLFTYRNISLSPLNRQGRAGEFEEKAFRLFEQGVKEVSGVYTAGGKSYFRYMAPLVAQQDCLHCHSREGWKPGGIAGGGFVSFEVGQIQASLRSTALLIMSVALITTALLLGLIYLFSRRLMIKTSEVMKEMERLALTDDLTGLFNRKQILTVFSGEFERARRLGSELGCVMLDITNFRDVNDRYGHLFGDELLRRVANRLKGIIRESDIIGRYGGEEFLLILPGIDRDGARTIALRAKEEMKAESAKEIPLSVSICLTILRNEDKYIDDMLRRVDEMVRSGQCSGDACEGSSRDECV
ncbi:MAG: diguanylate cyclase [Thermodesulfovibrionales bacterium]|jgi:diguanylate cyclase (GGDEF)-like protein